MTLLYVETHMWTVETHMSKHTCGQVLVLPSRRLVCPAADDDFAIGFTTPLLIS